MEKREKERERRNPKTFKEVTEAGVLCGKFGVSLEDLVAKLEAAVPVQEEM